MLEAALQSNLTSFGPNHPTVATSQFNLAAVLVDMEQLEPALALLQKAEKTFVLRLGEKHPYTKSVRSWIDSVQSRL